MISDFLIYLFRCLSTRDESQHEVEFNHPKCLCIVYVGVTARLLPRPS